MTVESSCENHASPITRLSLIIFVLIYNEHAFGHSNIYCSPVRTVLFSRSILAALAAWLQHECSDLDRANALPGFDAETGPVMLLYLDQAFDKYCAKL